MPDRQTNFANSMQAIVAVLLGMAMLTSFWSSGAKAAEGSSSQSQNPWEICAVHAYQAERERGLPAHLLSAISKVESGRWQPSQAAILAWPWTVTSGHESWFFPTKSEAVRQVESLQAQGRRNIDVGCMQVNLRHHPEAFSDLEEAFDPARNTGYAADLLLTLRQESRSWTKAIAFYHSRTPKFNGPYRLKVFRAWREERHRANRALQASSAT